MILSTHILDTSTGRPAAGVAISLARRDDAAWTPLNHTQTDADGRVRQLLPEQHPPTPAIYRIRFEVAAYFAAKTIQSLYPYIDIVFQVVDTTQHHHIPLLITAHGYTTYRGS